VHAREHAGDDQRLGQQHAPEPQLEHALAVVGLGGEGDGGEEEEEGEVACYAVWVLGLG
jgi:hypothetical protein